MDETELNIREEIIRTGIRMNELDIKGNLRKYQCKM